MCSFVRSVSAKSSAAELCGLNQKSRIYFKRIPAGGSLLYLPGEIETGKYPLPTLSTRISAKSLLPQRRASTIAIKEGVLAQTPPSMYQLRIPPGWRAPVPDQRSYCPQCRSGKVPVRDAVRDHRRRKQDQTAGHGEGGSAARG